MPDISLSYNLVNSSTLNPKLAGSEITQRPTKIPILLNIITRNEPHFNGVGRWGDVIFDILVRTLGRIGHQVSVISGLLLT